MLNFNAKENCVPLDQIAGVNEFTNYQDDNQNKKYILLKQDNQNSYWGYIYDLDSEFIKNEQNTLDKFRLDICIDNNDKVFGYITFLDFIENNRHIGNEKRCLEIIDKIVLANLAYYTIKGFLAKEDYENEKIYYEMCGYKVKPEKQNGYIIMEKKLNQ